MSINLAVQHKKVLAYSNSNRIIKLLRKFGSRIKKLEVINVPIFHLAEFKEFLTKTPLVENLTLNFSSTIPPLIFEVRLTKLKEFRHLKKLSIKNTPGAGSIMKMIAQDTLEELEIDDLSEEGIGVEDFQEILERQNNIKKIKLELQNVSLRHLKLDAYELFQKKNVNQRKLLDHLFEQLQLREFKTNVMVSTTIFLLITDLTNLVILHVPIDIVKPEDFSKIKLLVNLRELEITERSYEMWSLGEFVEVPDENNRIRIVRLDLPRISDIVLPKLERLAIHLPFRHLTAANYAELSQNLPNLKEMLVMSSLLEDLELVIQNIPNLKALQMEFDGVINGNSEITGSGKLEELKIIGLPFYCWNMKRVFDNVNACANLQRLALKVIELDEQLEIIIRSHPKLTHVYIELPDPELVRFYNDINSGYKFIDVDCSWPSFIEVLSLFQNSPVFKRFSFKFLDEELVEHLKKFADSNRSQMKLVIQEDVVELIKGNTDDDIHKHFARDINKKLLKKYPLNVLQ